MIESLPDSYLKRVYMASGDLKNVLYKFQCTFHCSGNTKTRLNTFFYKERFPSISIHRYVKI